MARHEVESDASRPTEGGLSQLAIVALVQLMRFVVRPNLPDRQGEDAAVRRVIAGQRFTSS